MIVFLPDRRNIMINIIIVFLSGRRSIMITIMIVFMPRNVRIRTIVERAYSSMHVHTMMHEVPTLFFLFSLSWMTIPLAFSFISYHYHNFSCNFRLCIMSKHLIACRVYHIISISCLPTYHVIPYMYHITKHMTHIISSNASHYHIYHVIHISYHNIYIYISFTYHISNISSNISHHFINISHISSI